MPLSAPTAARIGGALGRPPAPSTRSAYAPLARAAGGGSRSPRRRRRPAHAETVSDGLVLGADLVELLDSPLVCSLPVRRASRGNALGFERQDGPARLVCEEMQVGRENVFADQVGLDEDPRR